MNENTVITEQALLYLLECPLRSDGSSAGPESPILACADQTAHWLIDELAANRNPTAKETRDFFWMNWQKTAYFQSRDTLPSKKYQTRVLQTVRACRRLRDILWSREILQPLLPYELRVGDVTITGEYMVLRSSRQKRHASVLYLRDGGVKLRPLVPDVVSFARRAHIEDRWPDLSREWQVNSIGILHYWVSSDFAAEHRPNAQLARKILLGATAALRSPFPVPGKRCGSCPSRFCMGENSRLSPLILDR